MGIGAGPVVPQDSKLLKGNGPRKRRLRKLLATAPQFDYLALNDLLQVTAELLSPDQQTPPNVPKSNSPKDIVSLEAKIVQELEVRFHIDAADCFKPPSNANPIHLMLLYMDVIFNIIFTEFGALQPDPDPNILKTAPVPHHWAVFAYIDSILQGIKLYTGSAVLNRPPYDGTTDDQYYLNKYVQAINGMLTPA